MLYESTADQLTENNWNTLVIGVTLGETTNVVVHINDVNGTPVTSNCNGNDLVGSSLNEIRMGNLSKKYVFNDVYIMITQVVTWVLVSRDNEITNQ